jgi:hypothetical protein
MQRPIWKAGRAFGTIRFYLDEERATCKLNEPPRRQARQDF